MMPVSPSLLRYYLGQNASQSLMIACMTSIVALMSITFTISSRNKKTKNHRKKQRTAKGGIKTDFVSLF
jgi:hypothetical protein